MDASPKKTTWNLMVLMEVAFFLVESFLGKSFDFEPIPKKGVVSYVLIFSLYGRGKVNRLRSSSL